MSEWQDVGAVGSLTLTLATSCDHCRQPIPINGPVQVARCPHCLKSTPVPHLYEILRQAAKRTTNVSAAYNYEWFDDRGPECSHCGMDVPVDLARAGASTAISCRCGAAIPTYLAPDWLKRDLPTVLQIFGGDVETAHEVGIDPAPAKTVLRWTVTYRGDLATDARQHTRDDLEHELHEARAQLARTLAAVVKVAGTSVVAAAARAHAAEHARANAAERSAVAHRAEADRENRAVTHRAEAERPRRRSPLILLLVIPIAFFAMILTAALVPASRRLAAPIACPSDYSRSVVVLHTVGTMHGGTKYWADLWCAFADPKRPPVVAGEPTTAAVIFGLWLAVGFAFAFAIRGIRRRRA